MDSGFSCGRVHRACCVNLPSSQMLKKWLDHCVALLSLLSQATFSLGQPHAVDHEHSSQDLFF